MYADVGNGIANRFWTDSVWGWPGVCEPIPDTGHALFVVMLASIATFPKAWRAANGRAAALRSACQAVMGPNFRPEDARELYENPEVIRQARPFLRKIWSRGSPKGAVVK